MARVLVREVVEEEDAVELGGVVIDCFQDFVKGSKRIL